MNESINLPKLIAKLAAETGCDPAEARRFLHHLFSLVEESLLEGEAVTIKGVGEFHPVDDPSCPVKFRPDDTLAAVANEPFAAFSPTELNDGVTPEMLGEQSRPASELSVPAVPEPAPVVSDPVSVAPVVVPVAPEAAPVVPEPQPEPQEIPAPQEMPAAEEPAPQFETHPEEAAPATTEVEQVQPQPEQPAPVYEPAEQQDYYEPEPQIVYVEKKGANVLWFLIGILAGLVLGLVGGYFAGKYMSQYTIGSDMVVEPVESVSLVSDEESSADDEPAVRETTVADGAVVETQAAQPVTAADTQVSPATTSAQEPVYDTVTRSRFLTTMARDHYGKKAYWVFIFQANPQLKDPNKIAPGTRVKIPARESFAEPTEQATDEKAKKILNELSRRYNL